MRITGDFKLHKNVEDESSPVLLERRYTMCGMYLLGQWRRNDWESVTCVNCLLDKVSVKGEQNVR